MLVSMGWSAIIKHVLSGGFAVYSERLALNLVSGCYKFLITLKIGKVELISVRKTGCKKIVNFQLQIFSEVNEITWEENNLFLSRDVRFD